MRLTIFLLLTLLVFSASASNTNDTSVANKATDNDNSAAAQACSDCWKTQRNLIKECQSISSTVVSDFATLTDDALAANSTQYSSLIDCLCTLSNQVNTLITSCNCDGKIGQGLVAEASF